MRKNSVWIWVCYWRTAGHFWLHPSSFCISRYSDTVNKTLICVTDFHHSTTFCLIHASLVWTQSGVSAVNKLFINNWIRQALMNKSSEGEKYEFLNHFLYQKDWCFSSDPSHSRVCLLFGRSIALKSFRSVFSQQLPAAHYMQMKAHTETCRKATIRYSQRVSGGHDINSYPFPEDLKKKKKT